MEKKEKKMDKSRESQMIIVELCNMLAYDHDVQFQKMGMLLLPPEMTSLATLEACLYNYTDRRKEKKNLFYAWKDMFLEAALLVDQKGYEHFVHNKLARCFAVIGEEKLFEQAKQKVEQLKEKLLKDI